MAAPSVPEQLPGVGRLVYSAAKLRCRASKCPNQYTFADTGCAGNKEHTRNTLLGCELLCQSNEEETTTHWQSRRQRARRCVISTTFSQDTQQHKNSSSRQ